MKQIAASWQLQIVCEQSGVEIYLHTALSIAQLSEVQGTLFVVRHSLSATDR